MNVEHVQPVEQVFAEVALDDHLLQVAVRGADHANVHLDGRAFAEPLNFAGFEEAEQLHLNVLVEFAEFVEEDGAAVGDFEEALVIAVGPGERALLVAEELALGQVLVQRTAVHGNERHVGPRAAEEDRPRDDFFSRAGFTRDQHAAFGRPDAFDELLNRLHGRAGTDHRAGALGRLHARFQCRRLVLELALLLNADQKRFDVRELARLREVVESPEAECFHRGFGAAVPGHHHGFGVGRSLLQSRENLEAGLVVFHAQIENRGIERRLLDHFDRGPAIRTNRDVVTEPREFGSHELAQHLFVVDEQDAEPIVCCGRGTHVVHPPEPERIRS